MKMCRVGFDLILTGTGFVTWGLLEGNTAGIVEKYLLKTNRILLDLKKKSGAKKKKKKEKREGSLTVNTWESPSVSARNAALTTVTLYYLYLSRHDLVHLSMQIWQLEKQDPRHCKKKKKKLCLAITLDSIICGWNWLKVCSVWSLLSLYQSFIPTGMVAAFLKQLLKEERRQKRKKGMVCDGMPGPA